MQLSLGLICYAAGDDSYMPFCLNRIESMFGLAVHDPYFKCVSLRSRNASKNVIVEVSHALFLRYIEADPGFRTYDSPTRLSFPIPPSSIQAMP